MINFPLNEIYREEGEVSQLRFQVMDTLLLVTGKSDTTTLPHFHYIYSFTGIMN